MWTEFSNKGYYYDEEQDVTYINKTRLTDEEKKELITILGFSLDVNEEDKYVLIETRYQEGDIFEETFATIQEAFNRLDAYFDDSLYEFVTDETFAEIKKEHNEE